MRKGELVPNLDSYLQGLHDAGDGIVSKLAVALYQLVRSARKVERKKSVQEKMRNKYLTLERFLQSPTHRASVAFFKQIANLLHL
jgi:hypothetical protein